MLVPFLIRKTLKRSALVVSFYRRLCRSAIATLHCLSPVMLAQYRYRQSYGRWLDLSAPRTFDEKLLWLMLYWRSPLKTLCGDKYTVRSYVEECGLGHLLPDLLGVYDRSRDIDFRALPECFVLKCSHGSHFNIICRDKSALDIADARRSLDAWLKVDLSKVLGESHYTGMKPRIVCESFLGTPDGSLPMDYKVYCFNGRAHCTLVCSNRGRKREDITLRLYDRDWKRLPYKKSSLLLKGDVAKPDNHDEMIAAAEKLSAPFPFVRVDLYCIAGRTVFGEMTFTPCACIDTDLTDAAQQDLGSLISLPDTCV